MKKNVIQGTEVLSSAPPRTQVYRATHENNDSRSSYMYRSFISFSWGDKWIEDFDLISAIENNSIQRPLYANFEDNVTESSIWDGQLYWSSHYGANTLSFALYSDGITQKQLDDFKHYFSPGIERELILSENPYRAIKARVSEPPEMEMLPFEQKVVQKIAGEDYNTSTTLYKGKITLNFVMDEPFWYCKRNIMDNYYEDDYGNFIINKWHDKDGNLVPMLKDKDAIKIIHEDRIPTFAMLARLSEWTGSAFEDKTMLFGMDFEKETNGVKQFIYPDFSFRIGASRTVKNNEDSGVLEGYQGIASGSEEDPEKGSITEYGHVFPRLIYKTIDDFSSGQEIYFYYPGTAPVFPKIEFSVDIKINSENNSGPYINTIASDLNHINYKTYNTITITCKKTQKFSFSLPALYNAYNEVISIFTNIEEGASWEDVRILIRETVKHHIVRAFAIKVMDEVYSSPDVVNEVNDSSEANSSEVNSSEVISSSKKAGLLNGMKNFITNGQNDGSVKMEVSFDGATGEAKGILHYYDGNEEKSVEENVGDMLRSKYLKLEDRNDFDENGYVHCWQEEHPEYSYKVSHDLNTTLNNFNIVYKYMYL